MPDEPIASGTPENPAPKPPAVGLQFDRADFKGRPALTCSTCQAELSGEYYKIDDKVVCTPCRQRVEEFLNKGSDAGRIIKALIFGSIAALVGTIIYYIAFSLFKLQVLVAILTGYIVGVAVRFGSEQRGGIVFQLLAVILTYLSISGAYLTIGIAAAMAKRQNKPAPAVKTAEGSAKESPSAATSATAETSDDTQSKSPPSLMTLLAVLIPATFTFPILIAMQSPFYLLIFGFGLYEAWKINSRAASRIQGPFFTAAPQEVRPGSA